MMVQVGDIWEDTLGREVEALRRSITTAKSWWCKPVSGDSEIMLYENELSRLISTAPLPYITSTGVYDTAAFGYTNGVWGPMKDDYVPYPTGCAHAWVDAGFHFSVWCCSKCNVDKPKE